MGKKVLIADDEPDMLRVVEFRLKKRGYETVRAVDGKDALEKIREHKPDIVILDYRMPFLDGFEVCRQIKADDSLKHIPVILLTASDEVAHKKNGAAQGVDAFLVKPFEPEDLFAMLEKYA